MDDIDRKLPTKSVNNVRTLDTSSCVLSRPNVNLRLLCASSSDKPSAISTCDGSRDAEVQALPLEAAIPSKSRPRSKDSPSTC